MNYRKREKALKPRKILNVKPSKYEASEAIHTNIKYWKEVFQNLDSSGSGTLKNHEIRLLSEALPQRTFENVCDILHIRSISQEPTAHETVYEEIKQGRSKKEPFLSLRQTFKVDVDVESDMEVEIRSSDDKESSINIHQEFLKKPVREQITWPTRFLEPEKEDEKSLVKKADDLTNRIVQEFCDFMKELGGDQQSQLFTPKTIKELFQIEFDTHAARSLQVVPKELPTVDERVANVTGNKRKSKYATLEREVSKDIKAEAKPNRTKGFNKMLPPKDQYIAPKNDTKNLWRSARHVPKDLVTLKAVWEDITNLRSVKEYCRWMINHPEYRRAPYLSSLGMFDSAVLNARLTFETQNEPVVVPSETVLPDPVQNIRKRLSDITEQK
ncbi:uncharacterized protein LOC126973708 [Leptidea sinapis]|uniref:uncharacterized protein LOC126973708 n=1 Tax=Leptidea sinapis TaxID=189913 RepID=UPI002128923C|nr:uncharacterized protein LOC126973708 [Leptidea sinapis]